MKRLYILALLCFVFNESILYSQDKSLQFDNMFNNSGNIIEYDFEKFTFKFKNVSKKPIKFTVKNRSYQVAHFLDKKSLNPQEEAKLVLEFYPEKAGMFQEFVELEDSEGSLYKVKILGYITSLSKKYLDMDKDNSLRGDKDVIFIVVDDKTLDPLPNSTLNIYGVTNSKKYERKTDNLGVLKGRFPEGSYRIEGYFEGIKKTITGTEVDIMRNVVMILMGNELEPEKVEIIKESKPELIEGIIVPDTFLEVEYESDKKYVDSRKPLHLTLMIDISGSMKINNRIDKLKSSLEHLIVNFQKDDKLSIITFNDSVYVNYKMKSIEDKHKILYFIYNIEPKGNTQGVSSINSVINILGNNQDNDAMNMVLLSTDGELTSNGYEDKILLGKIDKLKESGVQFSVLAFSKSQYSQGKLKRMADIGGGVFVDMNSDKIEKDVILKNINFLLNKN